MLVYFFFQRMMEKVDFFAQHTDNRCNGKITGSVVTLCVANSVSTGVLLGYSSFMSQSRHLSVGVQMVAGLSMAVL